MSFLGLDAQVIRVRELLRQRRADKSRQMASAQPFSAQSATRLLLVTQGERIPQSQIFAFHHFAADLKRLHGAEVREADLWDVLAGKATAAMEATVVAFQTPFDVSDEDLSSLFTRLRADHPGARIGCLDWFAPTDLRNAARMNGEVDFYVKKHVFRDRSRYGQPTVGDTNLTDYYNQRFGISEQRQRFQVPPDFLKKLVVGPSFLTSPLILPDLLGTMPNTSNRAVDLHARFETASGTPWYRAMRGEADAAVDRCSGLTILRGQGVRRSQFLAEMRASKVCLSPFGYGEVCWRDYEAIQCGAVLVKPDMSHVETDPDIFVPWETYVPVAWDMADLRDVLDRLLSDSALRNRIASKAFQTLQDWLRSNAFARRMGLVLNGGP
ncbi:MAG TPA: glycosyltransferase [Tabrizicola sp.]|nr:glycosyltransferase [Tabrizicola sp.]